MTDLFEAGDVSAQETPAAPPARPVASIPANEAALVRVALRVLSGRAVAILGVALVFALGCWAMLDPTPLRVLVAGGFAVFSLLAQMLLAWAER